MKRFWRHRSRRGVAVMEFTISLMVLIPLTLGGFVYGFKLIRALQMEQIVRDVGHMYVRGIDFRAAGSVSVAQTLASGFTLTSTGTSELILSEVGVVSQADCDAAGIEIDKFDLVSIRIGDKSKLDPV